MNLCYFCFGDFARVGACDTFAFFMDVQGDLRRLGLRFFKDFHEYHDDEVEGGVVIIIQHDVKHRDLDIHDIDTAVDVGL